MAGVGEALVSAVLKEVLRKLGSAVGEQIVMRWNLKQDLENIKNTLGMLQAVLRDAERRSVSDEGVSLWLKRLKNAAYDISDMLDEFQAKLSETTFSSSVAKLFMGKKLKNMRARLTEIAAERTHFGFTLDTFSRDLEREEISKRETTSKINKSTVVGRNKEKEEVLALLESDDEEKMLVIPIFGFGGIGKTTLAKLVFNDDRIQTFDLRSEGLDDLQSISNCLEEILDGKSCLIVLDDLWQNSCFQLGELTLMLSSFKAESRLRIVVTTRNEEVARKICTVAPYKLKPLSDDQCWTLFRQSAFLSGCTFQGGDKNVLDEIGWEISKKCKGVPLAVQSLGFILRTKDVEEWKNVRDSDVRDGSSPEDVVLPSLKLSCEIYSDDLIQQWISLGFIQSRPNKHISLEKIGEQYVSELLGMSFLQYSTPTSLITREDAKCSMVLSMHDLMHDLLSMHDLMHDLARCVIGDELLLMDTGKEYNSGEGNCRYALLINCVGQTEFSYSSTKLRAIRFFNCDGIQLPLFTLRVLDISKCSCGKLPASIGKLKQLKFLSATGMQHETIPEDVTKLSKLIYLNINGSLKISTLPKSVNKLRGLLRLDLSGCRNLCSLPNSFGGLTNLSHLLGELQYLNLSRCLKLNLMVDINVVCCLTKLQYLNLSRCSSLIHLPETVSGLKDLHTLDISGCQWIEIFPKSICEITGLKFLLIQGCSPWLEKRVRESQFKNDMLALPKFIVQRAAFGMCSNISRLQSVDPAELEIECLENVTSIGEVDFVKLTYKSALSKLALAWTPAAERFVEDEDLLRKLQPPETLKVLQIQGYMATSFAGWMMNLASCLPYLVRIEMVDLPRCEYLPPFGQLQHLELLILRRMLSLRKLGEEICGGNGAFRKLREFTLVKMDNLNEWITKVSANGEFMFPSLCKLEICQCPILRLNPCLPRALEWRIEASDEIIADFYHTGSSSSLVLSKLHIRSCHLLPNEWTLLQFLPDLQVLEITHCWFDELPKSIGYQTSLRSLQIDECDGMNKLWLVNLSSLQELIITGCLNLVYLPAFVQKLSALEKLEINDNDALQRWCRNSDSWISGNDIKNKIYFDGKLMSSKKHLLEEEGTSDVVDRNDVRDYTIPWDEDEYVDCFAMLELGESSRMGR
uniref:Rx N-terminal domain-containing protein n=1 Tax=Oryza punctata TaxID=4537 RepID=A0A0E0K1Y9_ORYPU